MCCEINILSNIIIPLISAFIGGGITLIGVIITIQAENKKSRREYLEKIKPFFVVEKISDFDLESIRTKSITIPDDSEKDVDGDKIVFHWNNLIISNMSENVCMVSYIKINGQKYASFDDIPIKPGEFCEIKGYPFSIFIRQYLRNITIGFCDKNFNLYEYPISFQVTEHKNHIIGWEKYCHKEIVFSRIDCNKKMLPKQKRL